MKRFSGTTLIAMVITVLWLLMGCSTKTVKMTVLRPAEVNLKPYPKIALGDFTDHRGKVTAHSNDVADNFTAALIASGRFDVVDRQHLKKILQEQKLALSGLMDESSAPEVGRLLGASAFIFGRITLDKYQEEITKDKPYKDKKGRKHQRSYRKGKYQLSVTVKIIDTQTAKILAVKELSCTKHQSRSALDKTPPKIDRVALFQSCLKEVTEKFTHLVSPYKQTVRAEFVMDDALPEAKQAVELFKGGEWQEGVKLLQAATQRKALKKEVLAKAYYNLGLAQMYLGQHDPAIKNLKQALLLNPSESRYQKALKKARKEKKMAQRLREQL